MSATNCSVCNRKFQGGESYVVANGKAMCQSCAEAAMPKCTACGKKFAPGSAIQQLGSNGLQFHPECVKCSVCSKQITGGFKIESEKPLVLKCAECLQPNCAQCGNKILEAQWMLNDKKQPICENCVPRCVFCNESLAGAASFTIPDIGAVHAKCFTCARCAKNLVTSAGEAQFVKLTNGKPGCFDCRNIELKAELDAENERKYQNEEAIRKKNELEYHLRWHESDQISNRKVLGDIGVDVSAVLGASTVGAGYAGRGTSDDIADHVTLVLDKQGLHVVPTANPEAEINLDYLIVALRSYTEGDGTQPMAPVFSLDPVLTGVGGNYMDTGKTNQDWQQKRFIPSWMEGTVFGEVLFQADYALKELGFATRNLPKGMKSMWQMIEETSVSTDDNCAARQWFCVKEAHVKVGTRGELVPCVTMQVKAHESKENEDHTALVDVDDSLQNVNAPPFKFAQEISQYMEHFENEIPVVKKLKDVLRAATVARYLVEHGAVPELEKLKELTSTSVFHPDHPESRRAAGEEYHMRIPTLLKERKTMVSDAPGQVATTKLVLYGGIDTGVPSNSRGLVEEVKVQKTYIEPSAPRAPLHNLIRMGAPAA